MVASGILAGRRPRSARGIPLSRTRLAPRAPALTALACICGVLAATDLAAQQRDSAVRADSDHVHGDTLGAPVYSLPAITITAARTARQTPVSAVSVERAQVERSLATSTPGRRGNGGRLLLR